jgi:hypothetical protein
MRMPGFTGDASLYRTREPYPVPVDFTAPVGLLSVLPQLGIGDGITGPVDGDEYCYYCVQWVRVPCGFIG